MYFVHAGGLFPSSVPANCLYHLLVIPVFKKKKNDITYLDNLMIFLVKSGGVERLFTKKLITSTCLLKSVKLNCSGCLSYGDCYDL